MAEQKRHMDVPKERFFGVAYPPVRTHQESSDQKFNRTPDSD